MFGKRRSSEVQAHPTRLNFISHTPSFGLDLESCNLGGVASVLFTPRGCSPNISVKCTFRCWDNHLQCQHR